MMRQGSTANPGLFSPSGWDGARVRNRPGDVTEQPEDVEGVEPGLVSFRAGHKA